MKPGTVLQRSWQSRGVLALLLLPITLLHGALLLLRRTLYRCGLLKSRHVDCAVLVVGNAIVGGAGKTPTTIGIVQHLLGRGLAVGVVSRGYGRTDQGVRAVTPSTEPELAGDEPLLIARATRVPVYVAAQRHAAATALLAAHPRTQVIVCDDGLQHYPLYRDLEVCVFDDRGLGNGLLLPSGPLRQHWPAAPLRAVGQDNDRLLVLHTGAQPGFAGFHAQRSLANHALSRDALPVPFAQLRAAAEPPLLALAGIARPEVFFAALRQAGLTLQQTLALGDHFDFNQLDAGQWQGYRVLCTEKDAVKLWKICPTALAVPLLQTLEPAFLEALDRMLDTVLAAKLSSSHGHQTA